MYKSKIAFLLFIIGSFSLIIATLITSIPLSNLDREINETRSNIDKHLSQTKSTLSMGIFYELKYLKIQMDYFQRNILIQTDAPRQSINHLEKRMEEDMGKLVEGWYTLNSGKEYNTTLSSAREDINKILENTSLSHKDKLDKLDILLAESVKKANSKQTETEKQFDRNQDLLISLKDEVASWKSWFTMTQVIGLILIFASQLLEKSTVSGT